MIFRSQSFKALLVLLLLPQFVFACMWDYDTLMQERSRFPSTLELITGKFLHHSKEFYEWRIADRLKKLEKDPKNLNYLDDLGVAYEKTGDHKKAIETMFAKEAIKPGQYETYANLGTFYFHAGDFEQGLIYIDKALLINPDAHFGRERYQKWLVEYLLAKQKNGKTVLPLYDFGIPMPQKEGMTESQWLAHSDFYNYCVWSKGISDSDSNMAMEEKKKAIKGVLGMMRFGSYDSPILLEAMAHLLAPEYKPWEDAKQLAARCYLQASYQVQEEHVKERYRWLARETAALQSAAPDFLYKISIKEVESEFQKELADAQQWQEELKAKEIQWINEGRDVEAEFNKLYANEPRTIDASPGKIQLWLWWFDVFAKPVRIVCLFVALACLAVAIKLAQNRRRKKRDAMKQ